jgi:hypothetical protein
MTSWFPSGRRRDRGSTARLAAAGAMPILDLRGE